MSEIGCQQSKKEQFKMENFRPKMDFMKAKRSLSIDLSVKLYEMSLADVQKLFVAKINMVRLGTINILRKGRFQKKKS